ncbi:MAG: putative lipid II flippase FtsW [Firmicutes bacterium]|nr:putative lipid II flippase FtsW [Bacillota bacterium]
MKKDGKYLFAIIVIIALFGSVMIYSASSIWAQYKFNDGFHYAKLQLFFLIVSIIAMMIVSKIDYQIYKKYANLILLGCFILLVLVLIPGIGMVRNGSRSWFAIGPVGMQPSEFAKVGLIIFLAKYLAKNQKTLNDIKKSIFPVLGVIMIFFGLIMLEPDFGSAMVIVLTLMVIIFSSGVKLSFFASLGVLGLIGVAVLIVIAPYRLKRIVSFLNPWTDPLGSGYQIIQSLYAIGPGGLFGLGFGNSIQKQFYLPEPQTDFIFSIISEEFGFMGVLMVTFAFGFMYYQIIKISLKQTDLFAKYLSFGLGTQIILQALLNLCVVVGLIPVTGVTLPFISYGGSSLLVSMASIGIILNISRKNSS